MVAAVIRIAVLDDYLGLAMKVADWSSLMRRGEVVVFDRPLGADVALELQGFDIICTLRERQPFPAALIEALPALRYLCITGKRYDTVDTDAARRCGVTVSNTPVAGAGMGSVTELTWALILSLARQIPAADKGMREGAWQLSAGTTLRGKRLGVVGLGGIGTEVARIGNAFGMDVVAWSPHLTAERAAPLNARAVEKHALFATSDIVSLHLALAPSTRGVVGAAEIAAMKRTAWIVNTARAGLVDESALIAALLEKRIGGAALDVYSTEPLPTDHPLRRIDNTVLAPHLGYVTVEMLQSYYEYAVENITAFLDGAPIRVVA